MSRADPTAPRPEDLEAVEPTDDFLSRGYRGRQKSEPEPEPKKKTPHARTRGERRLGATFPSAAWVDAVRDLAEQWNVRPADVLVMAVSRLMADLDAGEVEGPTRPAGFQDRAGEMFSLPWGPR